MLFFRSLFVAFLFVCFGFPACGSTAPLPTEGGAAGAGAVNGGEKGPVEECFGKFDQNHDCEDDCFAALGLPCDRFEEAFLKASNADPGDDFGYSVALTEDTLAVGAPGEASKAKGVFGTQFSNTAPSSGAVYVFRRREGGWFQEAYLKASNSEADDEFGRSIALSGDSLVVGASGEDSSAVTVNGDQANNDASRSGAAYVFRRTDGVWGQEAYLKSPNSTDYDFFGAVVALSGDTLAISAFGEANDAVGVNGSGADTSDNVKSFRSVYVFERSDGVWFPQAHLKARANRARDDFGWSLALSGDTLAVGAQWEGSASKGVNGDERNDDAFASGAVYVFRRLNGEWAQEAFLKSSNSEAGDAFGYAVSLFGETLAVGAIGESSDVRGVNRDGRNNDAPNSGAVYVFRRSAGRWSQEAYIKASNTEREDAFGSSVALVGDWLAVGASGEDGAATDVGGDQTNNDAPDSGAVYLLRRIDSVWAQAAYVKSSGTSIAQRFGEKLALSEVGTTLAVGVPREIANGEGELWGDGPATGAVFLRRLVP